MNHKQRFMNRFMIDMIQFDNDPTLWSRFVSSIFDIFLLKFKGNILSFEIESWPVFKILQNQNYSSQKINSAQVFHYCYYFSGGFPVKKRDYTHIKRPIKLSCFLLNKVCLKSPKLGYFSCHQVTVYISYQSQFAVRNSKKKFLTSYWFVEQGTSEDFEWFKIDPG